MLTIAFLGQLTSSSLYKRLRHSLILPSISHIRKLSTDFIAETGKLGLHYMKQRRVNLMQLEKVVVLMFDEVYTAQRVAYSNGAYIGLTEDGTPAKMVLAFP